MRLLRLATALLAASLGSGRAAGRSLPLLVRIRAGGHGDQGGASRLLGGKIPGGRLLGGKILGGGWTSPLRRGDEFKLFAHYSHAAYTLKDGWSGQSPDTAGTVVEYRWHSSAPASVGYLGRNDRLRLIIVTFRGTKDVDDWIQDSEFSLDRWPARVPGSMVHHGFLNAYQAVAGNVTREVARLAAKYPSHRVVFTGHSLGGAEAVLCAVDVLDQQPGLRPRARIYTYGMPRIGNREWADGVRQIGVPTYRVVYENDLVPHVPFQWLGYMHFAQEVWIHQNKTVFCGAGSGEAPQCSAQVGVGAYSVADHSQYAVGGWEFAEPGQGPGGAIV